MPSITNLDNSNLNSLQLMNKINENITDLNKLTDYISINNSTSNISIGKKYLVVDLDGNEETKRTGSVEANNIININGGMGNTLTFNKYQVNIDTDEIIWLHSMENNPMNGFGLYDGYKRGHSIYARYVRFWVRGATNGSSCKIQCFANHYYNHSQQLVFIDGTDVDITSAFTIFQERDKGQTTKVTPWYDTDDVGSDGFKLGIKNLGSGMFYCTQIVLEFTHSADGLS
tara:strand:+ start:389 stop:1075 length:687 start_codon:yes stop_codon:yes gene_type:complete